MIKRVVLLLSLLALSAAAFADAPIKQYSYYGYVKGSSPTTLWAKDMQSSCDGWAGYQNDYQAAGANEATYSCNHVTTTMIYLDKTCTKSTCGTVGVKQLNSWSYTPSVRNWCASGVAPDTSKPLDAQCPASCPKGVQQTVRMNFGVNFSRPFAQSDIPSSYGGCAVDAVEFKGCRTTISTGNLYCTFVVENSGATSSEASNAVTDSGPGAPGTETQATLGPVKAPNALPCPKGTVQAGMSSDGVPLCVGTGTSPPPGAAATTTVKPETSVTNADGSVTKTQVTEITNADGSITTQTKITTVAADGTSSVKNTSNTGNTPSGAPGKQGANGADGKGLCETNPNLAICRDSSVTGDCNAGVSAMTCTGDAVQCATLRQAANIACKQKQDELDLKASAIFTKGSAVVNGTDPDASSLPSMGNAASVAVPTSLDTAGFAGGGAAFSDVTFTIQGKSITIPLNKWSSYLEAFRYVMMVIASLVSFRLLSGAILRD